MEISGWSIEHLAVLKPSIYLDKIYQILPLESVATPPTVRAEWAFKIFDSDGDQLLGENDIRSFHQHYDSIRRSVVDAITGTDETAFKSLDETDRKTVVRNVLR